MTRKAFENAIAVVMATGGSTNAVLHLLAIAHSMKVDLKIEDFETIRGKVPVLCDLKPSGKYVATDLHKVGGIPLIMKILLEKGILHGDCLTITGKTIAENLAEVSAQVPENQDVVRSWENPLYSEGHLAILGGNLAEENAVAKLRASNRAKLRAKRKFSIRKKKRWRQSSDERSKQAMSSSFVMKDRKADRECAKCSRRLRRLSAWVWAIRSD